MKKLIVLSLLGCATSFANSDVAIMPYSGKEIPNFCYINGKLYVMQEVKDASYLFLDGKDGADGKDGVNGENGEDGKPGENSVFGKGGNGGKGGDAK